MDIHAKLLIVQKEDGTEGMQTNFPCWLTEYRFSAGRGFLDSTSIHSGSLPRGRQCALQTLTSPAVPHWLCLSHRPLSSFPSPLRASIPLRSSPRQFFLPIHIVCILFAKYYSLNRLITSTEINLFLKEILDRYSKLETSLICKKIIGKIWPVSFAIRQQER